MWQSDDRDVWPPPVEDGHCEVAVIGGGMVGVSTAYRLAAAGVRVTLLEARSIGEGVTGHSSAKLSALQGTAYSEITRHRGREAALAYADLNAEGIRFVEATTDSHSIECQLTRRPAVSYAESEEAIDLLAAELDAARGAGLAVADEGTLDLPWPVPGFLRLDHQAQFNPVAWTRAMARAVSSFGGQVHEDSRVTGVEGLGRRRIRLESGRQILAEKVVLATHAPILDRGGYFARVAPVTSFAVTAELEEPAPQGLYLSVGETTRSISPLPGQQRGNEILVAGGGGRPGTIDSSGSPPLLRQFLRDHFKVHSIDDGWGAHDLISFDRLPMIGQLLPLDERVLVATGFSKWGLAAGAGAAAVLVDHVLGRDTEAMRIFNPLRLSPKAAPAIIRHNLDSGTRLVGDRIRRRQDRRDLAPGEGIVVGSGLGQKAISCDRDGVYRELSARCTHLGCIVAWNVTEQTWDCPCHGSRFSPAGEVVEGPAVRPLDRFDSKPPG